MDTEVKRLREKIEKFSKGQFIYELPFLDISEKQISIEVEAGRNYSGSFLVSNSFHKKMKGIVYCSSKLFSFREASFCGVENVIEYEFRAAHLDAGEVMEGNITVVTDCGEKELPFHVTVEPKSITTSIGKINDLFQFAGLAKLDWSEAKKVFKDPEFETIFLRENEQERMLYQALRRSSSSSQGMEEFLIAIHKKIPLKISIEQDIFEYYIQEGSFEDSIHISKNGWGYFKLEVSTDCDFIKLEQKHIWSEQFLGNEFTLSFFVEEENCPKGTSYANIFIKSLTQTITIPVVCHNTATKKIDLLAKKIRQQEVEYEKNYVQFRTNQKKLSYYLIDERNAIDKLLTLRGNKFDELYSIHLDLVSGKNTKAKKQIEALKAEEETLLAEDALLVCGLRYLYSLSTKDGHVIKKTKEYIEEQRALAPYDWRYLWLLLYVSTETDYDGKSKLIMIKNQFELGVKSPILYYEALRIYEEDPSLLTELGRFECQVMNFGAKHHHMGHELAMQCTYLAQKEKVFHTLIYRILSHLYKLYPEKELLTAICGLIIKGNRTQSKYFEWFERAVEEELRITELYEYYMYTFDEQSKKEIAQPVLLYFSYHSKLSNRKKAFLYAYIMQHKETLSNIYEAYRNQILEFVRKMLHAEAINANLGVIYEKIIYEEMLYEEPYQKFALLMYSNELKVNAEGIKGVYVFHKELTEPEYYPVENGLAYPSIYSENTVLVFVDEGGNRFVDTIEYEMKPMFSSLDFGKSLVEHQVLNRRLMIQQMERVMEYQVFNEAAILFRRQVLELEGLRRKYENDIYVSLMEYYYDANLGDELENLLQMQGKIRLPHSKILRVIELMIYRGLLDEALDLLRDTSYQDVPVHCLLRFCSKYLMKNSVKQLDETLVSLCYYVFDKGKYDEGILQYLNLKYEGPTKDLFLLWKASKDFDIDTHFLEERLLSQMLFSECYVKDSFEVFNSYYHNINQNTLTKAFLSYFGFKYLHNDRVIRTEIFDIMKRELNYEENDIYRLSLLKYYATRDRLNVAEKMQVELYLNKMYEKNIIMPFFLKFAKYIPLPEQICDRFYVEYHADPSKKVYIHYRIAGEESEDGYICEQMQNVCIGIYVKDFICFYGEIIQYYITEEIDGEEIVKESYNIRVDKELGEIEEGDYQQINLMLVSREMKDDEALLELIEQYGEKRYLFAQCFKPI